MRGVENMAAGKVWDASQHKWVSKEATDMSNYTYSQYLSALDGAGPKLKEIILERAAHDEQINLDELVALTRAAYPDEI